MCVYMILDTIDNTCDSLNNSIGLKEKELTSIFHSHLYTFDWIIM